MPNSTIDYHLQTAEQGADGIVYCGTSQEVETDGGEYFMNCKKQAPNPIALDPSVQQKLWSTSQSLVGLKSFVRKDTIEIVTLTWYNAMTWLQTELHIASV